VDEELIYLGNSTMPSSMLTINQNTKDTSSLKIELPKLKLIPGLTRVTVKNRKLFVTEGHAPILMKGTLEKLSVGVEDTTTYFMAAEPLTDQSMVLKAFDGEQTVLAKKDLKTGVLTLTPKVLKKQRDGVFCMDGHLHADMESGKVVYVYTYRNQFIVANNDLNVLYNGKTIDTNSIAKIKLQQLDNGQTKFTSPPLVVNKTSAIDQKYLYINSGLQADNENKHAFKNHSVIDVYHLSNGDYKFSFYLPDYNGYKIRSFKVWRQTLLVLYDRYLIMYSLNFN